MSRDRADGKGFGSQAASGKTGDLQGFEAEAKLKRAVAEFLATRHIPKLTCLFSTSPGVGSILSFYGVGLREMDGIEQGRLGRGQAQALGSSRDGVPIYR